MKDFKHIQYDNNICLLKFKKNIIEMTCFNNKPCVGDYFMTHTRRETNNYHCFIIEEILENRDAKIFNRDNLKGGYVIYSQLKSSSLNSKNAYFRLSVRKLKQAEIPEEINTNIRLC